MGGERCGANVDDVWTTQIKIRPAANVIGAPAIESDDQRSTDVDWKTQSGGFRQLQYQISVCAKQSMNAPSFNTSNSLRDRSS